MKILIFYFLVTTLYLVFNSNAHSKGELESELINAWTSTTQ